MKRDDIQNLIEISNDNKFYLKILDMSAPVTLKKVILDSRIVSKFSGHRAKKVLIGMTQEQHPHHATQEPDTTER